MFDAAVATGIANKLVKDTPFKPISGRKEGDNWVIVAKLGVFEKVEATFVVPDINPVLLGVVP